VPFSLLSPGPITSPVLTLCPHEHKYPTGFCHIKVVWQQAKPYDKLLLAHSRLRIYTVKKRNPMESSSQTSKVVVIGYLQLWSQESRPCIVPFAMWHWPSSFQEVESIFPPLESGLGLRLALITEKYSVKCYTEKMLPCDLPRLNLKRPYNLMIFCPLRTQRPTHYETAQLANGQYKGTWKRTKAPQLITSTHC
jgi:hypothetical protein